MAEKKNEVALNIVQMERDMNAMRKKIAEQDSLIQKLNFENAEYIRQHQRSENVLSAVLWLALRGRTGKLIVSPGELTQIIGRFNDGLAFICQGENISGDYLLSAGCVASFEE